MYVKNYIIKVTTDFIRKRINSTERIIKESRLGGSSQDGGLGRHTVRPCTTKRRTTII